MGEMNPVGLLYKLEPLIIDQRYNIGALHLYQA